MRLNRRSVERGVCVEYTRRPGTEPLVPVRTIPCRLTDLLATLGHTGPHMELLTYSFMGIFAFLPSILLLFGLYLIWEQSKLVIKQLSEITRLLNVIQQQQKRDNRTETHE